MGNRFISGGDYNAKHPQWESRLMSPKGKELYKSMEFLKHKAVSTGEPTYWPIDRRKIPDVDFCIIQNINKQYLNAKSCLELSSDHSPWTAVFKKEKPCILQ